MVMQKTKENVLKQPSNVNGEDTGKSSFTLPEWYRQAPKKIPVTLLTGYLGSGKTTLLNHILHAEHGHKIAVIVNEFGEVGIDNKLVVGSNEELVEMNNGCICCTVRGDLVRALIELSSRASFESVLIETTGLADPAPVAQTFFMAEDIRRHFELDAFITVVDAVNIDQTLIESEEAQEQIAFADIILVNKADQVDEMKLNRVSHLVRSLNACAKIYHTEHSVIDVNKILNINAFDLQQKLEIDPTFLEENEHNHDTSIGSIVIEDSRTIDFDKFRIWLQQLLQKRGGDFLRIKGILNVYGMEKELVFQGVRMVTSSAAGRFWNPDEERRSQAVFIGRHLNRKELLDGFEQCLFEGQSQSVV